MISETFCVLPFLHLKVGVDGKAGPCCRFPLVTKEFDFSIFDVQSTPLEEVFRSPQYDKLRSAMLAGKKVEGCQQCYKDEAVGAKSLRMTQNMQHQAVAESVAREPRIRFLEVAVGNQCNLKCVMCNASYSFKWMGDETSLSSHGFNGRPAQFDPPKLVDNELRFSRETLSDLAHLKVVGGEPLLQSKMIDFLEQLAEAGIAKQASVEIYTNSTHWPSERAIRALGAFREVQLLFSIDGVGPQDEYIRYPTKWADVERNVSRWLEVPKQHPGIYLSCNFTINALNAYYYDRIADWWHEKTRHTPYERHLETTFVNDPSYMSMSLLPDSVKAAIKTKLERYRDAHPDRLYVKYNVKRIISRLALQPEAQLDRFRHYLASMDSLRGTDYATVFPELHALLRNHLTLGEAPLSAH